MQLKDKLTVREIRQSIEFVEEVTDFTGLTKSQLKWLFNYICIKDENGKWQGLRYGNNYDVVFKYDEIYIVIKSPLFFDTKSVEKISSSDKPTPFKKEYLVKSDSPTKQAKIKEYLVFPRYTGYDRVLNGEEEAII